MTIGKIFSRRFFWAQPQVSTCNRLEIIEEEPEIQKICKRIWEDITPDYLANLFVSMLQGSDLGIQTNVELTI